MPVDCLKGTCFDHFWDLGPKSKADQKLKSGKQKVEITMKSKAAW